MENDYPSYSRAALIAGVGVGLTVKMLAIVLWPGLSPPDHTSSRNTLGVTIARQTTSPRQSSDHTAAAEQASSSQNPAQQKNAKPTQADKQVIQKDQSVTQGKPSKNLNQEKKENKTWLRGYLRGHQSLPEDVYSDSQNHALSPTAQASGSTVDGAGVIAEGTTLSMGQTYHRNAGKCFVEKVMWGQDGQETVLYPHRCGDQVNLGRRLKAAVNGRLGRQ